MAKNNRIGDAELNAYIDDQLSAGHRAEIGNLLSSDPDLAARVMADIGIRDSLRLAFADQPVATAQTQAWARKLEKTLARRRAVAPLRRVAAAAAIFALGWGASMGWSEFNRPPDQKALLTKATQLGEKINVRLPGIPEGWSVIDARLADANGARAVQLTFDTPHFGRVSLLARNADDVGIVFPTVNTDEKSKMHWQLVSDSYELSSKLTGKPLEYAALELYQTLY